MKAILLAAVCVMLVLGCQTSQKSPSEPKVLSQRDRQHFAAALRRRDLASGEVFRIYCGGGVRCPAEFLAQQALSNCQPRRAQEWIAQIADLQTRNIFTGVLWALVSIERNDPVAPAASKMKETTSQRPMLKWPVQDEIWADEWGEITARSTCLRFTMIADKALREKGVRLARQAFSAVPEAALLRDASVIGLAMDVSHEFSDWSRVVAALQGLDADSPYLARANYLAENSAPGPWRGVLSQTATAVELSSWDLATVEMVPHAVQIPVVVQ